MTTKDPNAATELGQLNTNLAKVEALSQRLAAILAQKESADASVQGPSPELFVKSATTYWSELIANPTKMIEMQAAYWGKTLEQFSIMQKEMLAGQLTVPDTDDPKDRRFSNPLWDTHPYFRAAKQQYLLIAEIIENAVCDVQGLEDKELQQLEYFSQQIVDMFSPSNFLATNPDALMRALETEGQSLVDGLENLVNDLEANDGELLVSLSDKDAFVVGENLATSKGKVVFRNRMIELIQYAPQSETVHKVPLVLFPPWINKFYILDLKPQNSLIKWITEQGFTLFVVSWVNPDASYADVGLDTYVQEGYLQAISEVKRITQEPQVNAVGYCIGGTTLAMTLGLLKKRGDKSVKSTTFFTTVTDFTDQGELGVFMDDSFVGGIDAEVAKQGMLRSVFLSRTFSFLRSNDLIYGPAIRNYMLGQTPPAFDLLFWNGDSTNLPARMTVEYLRWRVRITGLLLVNWTCVAKFCRCAILRCLSVQLPAKPIISPHGNPVLAGSSNSAAAPKPLFWLNPAISRVSSIRHPNRNTVTIPMTRR